MIYQMEFKKYFVISFVTLLVLLINSPVFSVNPEYVFNDGDSFKYEQITDADITQNGNDVRLKVKSVYTVSVEKDNNNYQITVISEGNEIKDSDLNDFNFHNIKLLKKGEKWIALYDNKGKMIKEIYKSSISPFITFVSSFSDHDMKLNKPKGEKFTNNHSYWGFLNQEMRMTLLKVKNSHYWIENVYNRRTPDGTYIENVKFKFVYDEKAGRLIRGKVISENVRKHKISSEEFSLEIDWTMKPLAKSKSTEKIDW